MFKKNLLTVFTLFLLSDMRVDAASGSQSSTFTKLFGFKGSSLPSPSLTGIKVSMQRGFNSVSNTVSNTFSSIRKSIPSPFAKRTPPPYASAVGGKEVIGFTSDVENEPMPSVKADVKAFRDEMARYGARTGASVGGEQPKQQNVERKGGVKR